jgi:hypothetical protein
MAECVWLPKREKMRDKNELCMWKLFFMTAHTLKPTATITLFVNVKWKEIEENYSLDMRTRMKKEWEVLVNKGK